MSNLEIKLGKLLAEATVTARQITMQLFVQKLMVALGKQNYRLNDLLEALAEYARRREDWSNVVYHLEAARDEVVRAKTKITGQD